MATQLTYAGVTLLLDDAYGFPVDDFTLDSLFDSPLNVDEEEFEPTELAPTFRSYLENGMPLEDLRTILPPKYSPGPRQVAFGLNQFGPPPPMRLNQLYWPTGAVRHSYMHCLVTDKVLASIRDAVGVSGLRTAHSLKFETTSNPTIPAGTVTAQKMYMLLPKPLINNGAVNNQANAAALYILTFVDQRWFWRSHNTGRLPVYRGIISSKSSTTTSWESLLTSLKTALNLTSNIATPDIVAAHGTPHPLLTSLHTDPSIVLDAVAASLCGTVVANLDGTYKIQSGTAAKTVLDGLLDPNAAHQRNLRMGGSADLTASTYWSNVLPSKIQVVFQKHGVAFGFGDAHALDRSVSDYTSVSAGNGSYRAITTLGCAYFNESSTLTNDTTINALADLVATNAYAVLHFADTSYNSIVNWTPEAVSDHILWTWTMKDISTRIVARPYISGDADKMYNCYGADPPPESFWAKINGTNPATGKEDEYFWTQYGPTDTSAFEAIIGGLSATTSAYAAKDINGEVTDLTNRYVRIYRGNAGGKYLIDISKIDTFVYFELTENLVYGTAPAGNNAKKMVWGGAAYAATGQAITVYDPATTSGETAGFGNWVGRKGAGAFVGYHGWARKGTNGRYEIVWMEEQARFLKFKLSSILKVNASSVSATTVESWDGREVPAGTVTVYNNLTNTAGTYQFWGPADAVGIAAFDDSLGRYKIVSLETQAKYIEFTLPTFTAGTAGFTAGVATGATVNTWWDGMYPGSTVTVNDRQGLFTRALTGAKGIARWDEFFDGAANGGYIVIQCQSKAGWIDFTLTAAMASNMSLGATVNRYGGAGQDVQNPGTSLTVYDDQALWLYAPAGAKGRAIYDAVSDKYRIVALQMPARFIGFTVYSSALLTTSASCSATIDEYWDGVAPVGFPGTVVTVWNKAASSDYIFSGAIGHKGIAVHDQTDGKYRIIQMECP